LDADPRQLGFVEPLDPAAPRSAKPWIYPLDKASLDWIAGTSALTVALTGGGLVSRAEYAEWRNGSAELNQFAVTQDW
jgi:hypothetical protein